MDPLGLAAAPFALCVVTAGLPDKAPVGTVPAGAGEAVASAAVTGQMVTSTTELTVMVTSTTQSVAAVAQELT